MWMPLRLYVVGILTLASASSAKPSTTAMAKTATKSVSTPLKKPATTTSLKQPVTQSATKPATKAVTNPATKPSAKALVKPAAPAVKPSAKGAAEPGKLEFPFALPGFSAHMESSSKYKFDKVCFKFIHAAVGNRTSSDKSLSNSLNSLCHGDMCASWINSLSRAIDEQGKSSPLHSEEGVSAVMLSKPYNAWCRSVYHDIAGKEDPMKMNVWTPAVRPNAKKATQDSMEASSAPVPASTAAGAEKKNTTGNLRAAAKPAAPTHVIMPTKGNCLCVHRDGQQLCNCGGR